MKLFADICNFRQRINLANLKIYMHTTIAYCINKMADDHIKTCVKVKTWITNKCSILATFVLIFALLALFGLVYLIDATLPSPLYIKDEKSYPKAFITERARQDLKNLTDVGPHVAGSYESEVLVANFLKLQIRNIIQNAHKNQKIELDTQEVAGPNYRSVQTYVNSSYQNIIVKLHGNKNASHALLINAHFDSAPGSPGGSDDGINCAIMLEVLRKLSKEPRRLLNHVIFLFNGAEEVGFKGSQQFLRRHEWAKACTVVINLEAAGAAGKIILFQSGPNTPWLLDYYRNVPHPYAQVIAEELFQIGLIPSGLDMAFFKNGYRYHTQHDDFENIPLGSFQQAGDNTLSLARDLANASEVGHPTENPGKTIYFDFLGLFVIMYSEMIAAVLNCVAALLSIGVFIWGFYTLKSGGLIQMVKILLFAFGAIIGGWILSGLFVCLFAYFTDTIGYSMSWYSSTYIIFGLYVAPTITLSLILLPFVNDKAVDENVKSQIQVHCVRILWTVVLLIGSVLSIRLTYPLLIMVLFSTIPFVVIYSYKLQHKKKTWQIIYAVSLIVPTTFTMYVSILVLHMFVPLSGRIGTDTNVDLQIGLISVFFTILITSPFVSLGTRLESLKYLMISLSIFFAISFVMIFTPLGFPFSSAVTSPIHDNYCIIHTLRVWRSENGSEIKRDSGYLVVNLDQKRASDRINSYVEELASGRPVFGALCTGYHCDVPLAFDELRHYFALNSVWIPAAQEPVLSPSTKLKVLSKIYFNSTVLRYNLLVTGPNRMALILTPKLGVEVLNTSLIHQMPFRNETAKWENRTVYTIRDIWEKTSSPIIHFTFTLDLQVPPDFGNESTTEIVISSAYKNDDVTTKVPDFVKFVKKFPDWTDVSAWVGSLESCWI